MKMEKKRAEKGKSGFLYSLTLTIPLLIVLAALSVIGTIIPQNASEQEYLRMFSKETYYILKGFGLLNMYHSWWFIGVLILLAINMTACSLKRLPGVWRQVRKTKGGYARLGTFITHLSVLLILVGGLIGAIWGFKGYLEMVEGETMPVVSQNTRGMTQPGGFSVRCDSFRVEFYPNGSPKEYVSTLSFLQGKQVALDHVPLRVNHPLSYGGLTFYQTSYGISARATVAVKKKGDKGVPASVQLNEGEVQPIPGTESQLGFMHYEETAHDMGEAVLLVLFNPGASPDGFWLVKPHSGTGGVQEGDFTFVLTGIKKQYYTGLQVSRNPGLPLVWVGCSLLVIGMVVTFTLRRPPRKEAPGGLDGRKGRGHGAGGLAKGKASPMQ
jgi:cytochrome c biogenesis protein